MPSRDSLTTLSNSTRGTLVWDSANPASRNSTDISGENGLRLSSAGGLPNMGEVDVGSSRLRITPNFEPVKTKQMSGWVLNMFASNLRIGPEAADTS